MIFLADGYSMAATSRGDGTPRRARERQYDYLRVICFYYRIYAWYVALYLCYQMPGAPMTNTNTLKAHIIADENYAAAAIRKEFTGVARNITEPLFLFCFTFFRRRWKRHPHHLQKPHHEYNFISQGDSIACRIIVCLLRFDADINEVTFHCFTPPFTQQCKMLLALRVRDWYAWVLQIKTLISHFICCCIFKNLPPLPNLLVTAFHECCNTTCRFHDETLSPFESLLFLIFRE